MKFCSKCSGLMGGIGDGKIECIACHNIEEGEISTTHSMKKKGKKGEGVADSNNMFADYDFICKKCGYDKAQAIIKDPMISDEDHLIIMKCGKCGFSEQLARKVT